MESMAIEIFSLRKLRVSKLTIKAEWLQITLQTAIRKCER